MARSTKAGRCFAAIIWIVIVLVFLALFGKLLRFIEDLGLIATSLIVLGVVGSLIFLREIRSKELRVKRHERRKALIEKYKDPVIVDAIEHGVAWQGATEAQLRDSLGEAQEVDRAQLKTRRREVWKYRHISGNRFGLRVTLEDGVVTEIEEKNA